ncbi:hypothetical protein TREES_T100014071 [Tupaia chinensis]|uniref:Uncharacterized protein n=1 Tax=Tupaia chinensis TaxID=246437 RepID=L9KKQ0_TUPCH|nr:hypothetical protein TREES_T100014071 [Tupaia chinensis]
MDRDSSEEDSVMDLSFEAESPLAPPTELLERLPSYDWLLQRDRQQIFFPPLEALGRPQEQRSWSSFLEHRVPVVTEDVAREALLSFVNSKCCYGSAVAGDLVIRELKQQTLCRYRLETFSESRISEWTFQPFTNHSVDGPERGTSPRLWDIKVQVPPMFQEDTKKFQVPHSSLVKVRCPSCSGAKRKAKQPRRCQMCSGSGRRRCSTCSGSGNKTCTTCRGEKKLLHFIQLVIMWKNSLFEFVSEHRFNCPRELLAKARGENLFKDENSVVYPIVDFPLREICLASQRGIAEQSTALASRARVLQQDGLAKEHCGLELCDRAPGSWDRSLADWTQILDLLHPDKILGQLLPSQVYPIVDFPLREICLASQRGIAEHSAALASRARVLQQDGLAKEHCGLELCDRAPGSWDRSLADWTQILDLLHPDKILGQLLPSQRQTIELIPLTEVHYWYRGQSYVYYIYGTDHQVHAVDYPERYCFGCTII